MTRKEQKPPCNECNGSYVVSPNAKPPPPSGPNAIPAPLPTSLLKNPNLIYVVTMYRWGSWEEHSYVTGAYSTLDLALVAAKEEREYRGGKYEYEILEMKLDTKHPTHQAVVSTIFKD